MIRRLFSRAAAGSFAVGMISALAAPATAGTSGAGSSGLDDPYFPLAGNGGYDVGHYSLDLDYVRAGNQLDATAVITARATQDLNQFDLDLLGFTVSRVTVDRAPATFRRDGQELIVTPGKSLVAGHTFVVRVDYSGQPTQVIDPDGSSEGWVPTSDGAFVVNEPQGSPGWYPANDNPRDKATFDMSITVPQGITAIGNGKLLSHRDHDGKTTWCWAEDSPMAPYLATVTNGIFELRVNHAGQLPLYHAVDPLEKTGAGFESLAAEAEIIRFFSGLYGPYPFSSGGGIVDHAPEVGYALESQTRSQYSALPDLTTVVHEIAHQWFGDSVTLRVWPDIWLNEGFAKWSEWIYAERHGGPTAQEAFDEVFAEPATSPFWTHPTADLGGPEFLFTAPGYNRGAMTLQALRVKVGDPSFFRILRAWYANHRNGNVTTADFIALAKSVSGQQLDKFFQVWLFEPVKPTSW
jgi:aminopeptidase N